MEEQNSNPFLRQINTSNPLVTAPQPDQVNWEKPKKKMSIWLIILWIFFLLLFLAILLIFSLVIWWQNNPLLWVLWIQAYDIQRFLINLTDGIFTSFALVVFLLLAIWVFKVLLAKKEEKDKKRNWMVMSLVSFSMLFFTLITWFFIHDFIAKYDFFLNIKTEIEMTPSDTQNLVAPVPISFSLDKAVRFAVSRWKKIKKILWDFNDDGVYEKEWLDTVLLYEVQDSWRNRVRASLEFEDWTSEEIPTRTFFIGAASFIATPKIWTIPLEITFSAESIQNESKIDISEYRWYFDWRDSQPEITKESKIVHTFNKAWEYDIVLVTKDSANTIKKYTQQISAKGTENAKIINAKIRIYPGSEGVAPFKVRFDWWESSSIRWNIIKYEWFFNEFDDAALWKTVLYTFEEIWTHKVRLKLTDSLWNEENSTEEIKVIQSDVVPTATWESIPTELEWTVPFDVIFDASKSSDPNNDIVDYEWDFNWDQKPDKSWAKVTNTFRNSWEQTIILTVTDSEWHKSKLSKKITLSEPKNLAIIVTDVSSWPVPLVVSFDASTSRVETWTSIVNYEWDFGEWKESIFAWASIKHKYQQEWTYKIKLTIYTNKWDKYRTDTTIYARIPQFQACFEASKNTTKINSKIIFDSSCSQWDISTWTWHFWDWTLSHERMPIYEYSSPGKYDVTLEITNEKNLVSDYKQSIIIE